MQYKNSQVDMRICSKDNLLFGIMGVAAVLWTVFANTPTRGSSTMKQVSKANIDSLPFVFKVIPEDKKEGLVWFRVAVSPKADRVSWCVSGAVRIMKDEKQVGSFSIVESPPDNWNDLPEPRWRWAFAFTISREYLRNSRFTFFDSSCEMPSFDGYWLSLEEFYEH